MIVKMKKYAFLVFHQQYADFLEKVREIGVLHVVEKEEGVAENDLLREKMQLSAKIQKTIAETEALLLPDTPPHAANDTNGAELLSNFDALQQEKTKLQHAIVAQQKEAERMAIWGNFDAEKLEALKQNGYELQYFSCNERKFNPEWETEFNAFIVGQQGSTIFFVTVNHAKIELDADTVILNEKNQSELALDADALNHLLVAQQAKLEAWSIANLNNLKQYAAQVTETIDFKKVELNTTNAVDEKVMVLEGYCPEEMEEALQVLLAENNIYYEATNPKMGENIPVKLKNNFFNKLFEPITELFSLPNYSELDATPFIAPFFMLFFGLCLGDAGYGVLIFAAATWARMKVAPAMKPFATLGQWLGAATVIVGIITGAFFGIALDTVTWPWLAGVKHLFVTGGNFAEQLGGYNPMMIFAVAIGLIQIFFGMGVNAAKIIKQHGVKYALAPIAWIVGLLGSAITFGLPVAGIALPVFLNYIFLGLVGLSILLILFYNSPDDYSNPVKGVMGNVASALWAAYNMATGLLGDTLSYIRLFALGLTGSILGGVFNTLALDISSGMPTGVNWLVMLIILLLGHTINFGLCMIGAFVHPMRLTFVEFYKNSGFEGGGGAYKPFQKVKA